MNSNRIVVQTQEAPERKKRKKLPFILAGIGIIALVPVIGSTFAASITLGSGSITFAQGNQTTAACDGSIDVALASQVVSGDFKLRTVTLSNIDLTSGKCAGKTFNVYAVKSDNTTLEWVTSGTSLGKFTIPATASATGTATALTGVTTGLTGALTDASGVTFDSGHTAAYTATATVALTISSPNVLSSDVSKILLETAN